MRKINLMNLSKRVMAGVMVLLLGSALPAADLTLDDVFPTKKVLDVQITVPTGDWDKIRYQSRNFFEALNARRQFEPIPGPYTYVEASVTIDGVKFPKVGLRKKGFIGSQSTSKPSLKINLDEYVDGVELFGTDNVTLNLSLIHI